ncbi:MAG: winged helix-turn-helix transcriptional regulator [Eggerthellaceae bacterium]|jgi:DNA-binding HxlR family transcriptional regulator
MAKDDCFSTAVPTIAGPGCALRKVLDVVGGKWKILILCAINESGTVRYGQLRRMIYGITNTMLANSLRELGESGLVLRRQYNEMPVRVEYELTEKGKTLIPILMELKEWGDENL